MGIRTADVLAKLGADNDGLKADRRAARLAEYEARGRRIADFIDRLAGDRGRQIREVRSYPPHPSMTVDLAERHRWIYVTHVVTNIEPYECGYMLYINPMNGKVHCIAYSAR